jgi:serine/threonine-protein kinase
MAEVQQILCPICHKPNLRRANFCQHCGKDIVLNNDGPRYYITRIVKQGGQGALYETIGDDGKTYAVKEMLDNFTDPKERAEALDRFDEEAQLLQRLNHPRIPRIYASFKDEGRQYLAMDFVRGEDMEDIIRRRGALPEKEVLDWADQLCDVLSYLHHHRPQPIIFRDMKPSNVMVEPAGGVKLVDFGIAKVFQHAQRGTQIGTPGYAPPEQYQGLATPASDIYALAATLHHMLTGRDPRDEPPFSFPPAYGLKPTISKQTSEALQKALQMRPEDRFQSIDEFRAALRPLPPPQPQVRVAPKTTALPPQQQPQVAAQPATPTSAPRPQPQAPAVATAARPAAPATPAIPVAAQPPATPKPRRRGGFVRWLLVLMLLLGLGAGGLAIAFPSVAGQVLPGLSQPTATPAQRIYVPKGTFTITNQEIIVPAGRDVNEAYQEVFIQLARQDPQYGADAIINQNAPPAFIGPPEKVGTEQGGTRYRATMQGLVFVPK